MRLESKRYYPADTVRGVVDLVLQAPLQYTLLVAQVIGEEKTSLGFSLIKGMRNRDAKTLFYRQNIIVAGDASRASEQPASPSVVAKGLSPGRYTFPFAFQLPEVLPPAYVDTRTGGISKLSYVIKAKLFKEKQPLATDLARFGVRMLPVNLEQWTNAHWKKGQVRRTRVCSMSGTEGASKAGESEYHIAEHMPADNLIIINHEIPLNDAEVPDTTRLFQKTADASFYSEIINMGEGDSVGGAGCYLPAANSLAQFRDGVNDDDNDDNGSYGSTEQSILNISSLSEINTESRVGSKEYFGEGQRTVHGDTAPVSASVSPSVSASAEPLNDDSRPKPPSAGRLLWEQHFETPISSILKKGTISVILRHHSLIYVLGDSLVFSAQIDNTHGLSSITEIAFLIVSYVTMKASGSRQVFRSVHLKHVAHNVAFNESIISLPETSLKLPSTVPQTFFTDSYMCRTFFEMRVSCVHALQTQTASIRTEIAIVERFDTRDISQCAKNWTNVFSGRGLKKGAVSSPDIICSYAKNGEMTLELGNKEDGFSASRRQSSHSFQPSSTWFSETEPLNSSQSTSRPNFETAVFYGSPMPGTNPLQSSSGASDNANR